MLPEVEAYFNAKREYERFDRRARRRQVQEEYPLPDWSLAMTREEREAFNEAEMARSIALAKVDQQLRELKRAVLAPLAASEDPLIKWIGTNGAAVEEYPAHVDDVLRALPMRREDMDTFGDNQGWCGEYMRFYRLAEAADVLPAYEGQENGNVDVSPLLNELTSWYGSTNATRRTFESMIRKHLPALVKNYQQAQQTVNA